MHEDAPSRRSFLTRTAFLAVALPLAGAAPAGAAARRTPSPPAIGDEYVWRLEAAGTALTVNDSKTTVDLSGDVRLRVEQQDASSPWDLRLKVTGIELSGQDRQGLGQITIAPADTGNTPDSLLRMVSKIPSKWEQTLFLDFTLTIENPPQRQNEPLVLTTKNPGQLVGQLTQFPPRGELYRLQNPIDLVLPEDPDTAVASIQKFPVEVGGL